MNTLSKLLRKWPSWNKAKVVASSCLLAAAGATQAQNLILNGDFSANAAGFVTFPGYIGSGSNPANITDWGSAFPAALVGVNGSATVTTVFGPTTQTGYSSYGFIQGAVGALTQGLPSLVTNTTYLLSFDVAGRGGVGQSNELYRVQIGDSTQTYVTTQVGGADVLVADSAQFHTMTYTFTTPGSFNGQPSIQLYNIGNSSQAAGTVDFANVSLLAQGPPSVAFAQTNVIGYIGTTLTLNGTVVGAPLPTAQWFYNGSIITGQTNSSLSLPNIQAGQSGNYSLVASNAYGTATNTVLVSVLPPPPGNLVLNGNFSANAAGFTVFPGYTGQTGNPGNITDWANLTPGAGVGVNGSATATTVFGPTIQNGYSSYGFIQNYVGELIQNLPTMAVNTTYQLQFDVASRNSDLGVLYRVQIGDATQTYVTTQVGGSDVLVADNNQFHTMTYTFTTPASLNGTPSIQLYNINNTSNSPGTTVDFANVSVVAYGPPSVSLSQTNVSVYATYTTNLSESVVGVPSATVQWFYNGNQIPGATNDVLSLPNIQMNQAGNYSLVASNTYGAVTNTVVVSVLTPPFVLPIVNNPNSEEIYQGFNANFSAGVVSPSYVSVQWYFNGNPIPGANSQTLTVTNVGNSQQGAYTIVATNISGSVTSGPAMLAVINLPGNGTYASGILSQHPMGYWRFSDGGGTNAYDYVGGNNAYDTNYANNASANVNFGATGNPATLVAGPQPPAFPGFETNNTAPLLDGISQGYASSVSLFNSLSNFTIMGWFNINPNQYPIGAWDNDNAFINPAGRASLFGQQWTAEPSIYQGTNLYFYSAGITPGTLFANTTLVPGVWNFLAVVSDHAAGATTMYLNGAVVGTANACPGTVQPYLFSIGKNVSSPPSGGYDITFFPGSIDEVAAFDHALSAAQIQALYQTATVASVASVSPTNVVARVSNIGGNNNVIITGAGGSGSSGYTVLTTTNITTPFTNWTTLATGLPFGAGGSVNYTNPINPAMPQLYYRIRVP